MCSLPIFEDRQASGQRSSHWVHISSRKWCTASSTIYMTQEMRSRAVTSFLGRGSHALEKPLRPCRFQPEKPQSRKTTFPDPSSSPARYASPCSSRFLRPLHPQMQKGVDWSQLFLAWCAWQIRLYAVYALMSPFTCSTHSPVVRSIRLTFITVATTPSRFHLFMFHLFIPSP